MTLYFGPVAVLPECLFIIVAVFKCTRQSPRVVIAITSITLH